MFNLSHVDVVKCHVNACRPPSPALGPRLSNNTPMTMPTWREWLFSAKALIAALMALYIALAIP
ncbi:MAG TPA: hypothetical protein DEO97_12825, partial [Pseudomonas sp.]|nr:hypothetical protein [Pseudomonas sp.]